MNTDLAWLDKYQHPSGGVAYLPGRQPRIEPTAYAILAGVARPEDILWLRAIIPKRIFNTPPSVSSQVESPFQVEGRPWIVAAGMLALCRDHSQQAGLNIVACATYLRENHATGTGGDSSAIHIEPELAGSLPWNYGNYGWIQPTCWAIFAELALLAIATKKSEQEQLLKNLTARIEYVLARQTVDHGWNYGNTLVQGVEIPGHPLETAMVLTALGGIKNSKIASYLLFLKFDPASSFDTLDHLIQTEGSRLTLAWQKIAEYCWQSNADVADVPQGPPATGESSIDALLSYIASLSNPQQGFQFLLPDREP